MEINAIKPNNNGGQALPASAVPKADVAKAVAPKAENAMADNAVINQQVKDASGADKQRLETVMKAAKSFKSTHALNSMTFTIFKDSTGQFVTRFTDHASGRVTYIPEPDIMAFMDSASERRAALQVDA